MILIINFNMPINEYNSVMQKVFTYFYNYELQNYHFLNFGLDDQLSAVASLSNRSLCSKNFFLNEYFSKLFIFKN
ncbi:hypothetical protein BpHYR1_033638 [Brachionus plicatilis]|uniref:Uncharacterized protein n=1 Tax=Brachionus plicatilis TaxID=10195 RepID=A0A3M7Q564_BRAPC|nr:hypothetical protein BpHYR1_033638 [Brachionus plicatilis]